MSDDDVRPSECDHPLRDREMICSTCGILLHDAAIPAPSIVRGTA